VSRRLHALALITLALVIVEIFIGSLVSGLGQGYDLGASWPGSVGKILSAIRGGSLEPVHRVMSAALGVIYATLIGYSFFRWIHLARGIKYSIIFSLVFFAVTVWMGRLILLALGGYLQQPWSYLVFPINHVSATLAAAFLSSLVALSGKYYGGHDSLLKILLRGTVAWGLIATALGSLIVGITKTGAGHFDVQYFTSYVSGVSSTSQLFIPWIIHGLASLITIALASCALTLSLIRHKPNPWITMAGISAILQLLVGYAVYMNTQASQESPGIFLGIHALLSQLIIQGTLIGYLSFGGFQDLTRLLSRMRRLMIIHE